MKEESGLLLVMADIDPANEEDFNRWYEEEHIPERLSVPGFHRARRFRAVVGGPKYLALYDVENIDVFKSKEYLDFYSGPKETEWTRRIVKKQTNFVRNIYMKISDKYSE